MKPQLTIEGILALRVEDTETGCWIWPRSKDRHGYGKLVQDGSLKQVHRVAYAAIVGPIPERAVLDHLCRNRACYNPAHLEPVPQVENVRRGKGGLNNARKTHCPKGHPYDEQNTYVRNGQRFCRACAAASNTERCRRYREKQKALPAHYKGSHHGRKTHCPQGHPYDEQNTYRDSRGRKCRTCNRDRKRTARQP